jgi:hypothetical protein
LERYGSAHGVFSEAERIEKRNEWEIKSDLGVDFAGVLWVMPLDVDGLVIVFTGRE